MEVALVNCDFGEISRAILAWEYLLLVDTEFGAVLTFLILI